MCIVMGLQTVLSKSEESNFGARVYDLKSLLTTKIIIIALSCQRKINIYRYKNVKNNGVHI